MRGNVLDLAIGVIIGAAFGAVVASLVSDVIMPPIGLVTGGMDFKDLFIALDNQTYPNLDTAKKAGAPIIAYGNFINTVINFVIVAFILFLVVRAMNRFRRKEPVPVATPPKVETLLAEIRDILARQSGSR